MKKYSFSLLLLFILVISTSAVYGKKAEKTENAPKWVRYEEVFNMALEQNKGIYLYFQSQRCPWCRTMDQKTLADPLVIDYLDKHYLSVRIDTDKEGEIAQKHQVSGLPSNLFFSSDGKKIYSRPGYIPHETFLRAIKILHMESQKK